MPHPPVSVVVPCYNGRTTIERCLASIFEGSVRPDRVVLVDSSDDGTDALVRERFPQVHVIHRPEKTLPGRARNLGVEAVTTSIVAMTDADCVVDHRWLERLLEGWAANPDAAAVGGVVGIDNPESIEGTVSFLLEFNEFVPGRPGGDVAFIPTCNISFRREVYRAAGGMPEAHVASEDAAFVRGLVRAGKRVVLQPSALIRHHNRTDPEVIRRHARGAGRAFALSRRQDPALPGSFLVRWERTTSLLPLIRLLLIMQRLVRFAPPLAWFLLAHLGLAWQVLTHWRLGFEEAPRDAARPPTPPSAAGQAAFLGVVVIGLLALGVLMGGRAATADELYHEPQIRRFMAGDPTLEPLVTMIPAYHALVAAGARLTGGTTIGRLRLVSFLMALPLPFLFLALRRRTSPEGAELRTLHVLALPLVLPLYLHLYTDLPALVPVLGMLVALESGSPTLAGLLGLAAMLMRQTAVVWVLFAFLRGYLLERGDAPPTLASFLAWCRRAPLFVADGVAFVVFVVLNGGVAVGGTTYHSVGHPGLGNVLLFCALVTLFLPHVLVAHGRRILEYWRVRPLALAVLVLVVVGAGLSFAVDHPMNQYRGYLHNELLLRAASQPWWRVGYLATAFLGALALPALPLGSGDRLLLPLTLVALIPAGLVEPRYALVPLVLLMAALPPLSRRIELGAALVSLAVALSLTLVFATLPVFL